MVMGLLASLLAATLIPVTTNPNVFQTNPHVASDGITRAAVWEEVGHVVANGLAPDNTPFFPNPVPISSPAVVNAHSPAIAALPGVFFIVWVENTTLVGGLYTRNLEQFTRVDLAQNAACCNNPRIAFDQDEWMVTYTGTEENRFTVNAVRVGFNGLPIDSVPEAIDGANDVSVTANASDVAWRGSRPVFTWVREAIKDETALNNSIAVGDETEKNLIESGDVSQPRIAASPDGDHVLVTWLRGTNLIARLNPDLSSPPPVPGRRYRAVARPELPLLSNVGRYNRYTLRWNGSGFEIIWQPDGDTSIMRTTLDEFGTNVSTSVLTHNDDPAVLLQDSVDSSTLMVSSGNRLFWLIP